MSVKSSGWI